MFRIIPVARRITKRKYDARANPRQYYIIIVSMNNNLNKSDCNTVHYTYSASTTVYTGRVA